MKHLLIISAFVFAIGTGCNTAPVQPVANSTAVRNANSAPAQNTIAHSAEPSAANLERPAASKWSAGGEPIDTAKFDGTISTAEKAVSAKPNDEAAKRLLAQAFYDRGFALTEARQYAAAIGDYRRALKHDPNHEESKKWINQITSIYQMLKKDPPKEGEEPKPLPFKKD